MNTQRMGMVLLLALLSAPALRAQGEDLPGKLRALDAQVIRSDRDLRRMLSEDIQTRRQEMNQRETRAWRKITTKQEWERYRDKRLQALRTSLGDFPTPAKNLKVSITRTLEGEGYRIDNLVFESRPGLLVTANRYRPAKPGTSMPGILICHSHHNPKTQGELQDMGILWARRGCVVLVMDQLGHGERRQHPFVDSSSYPGSFRVGRQDYYFRYNEGIHLHLIGDSLIGWMAWDLMRGVDLLLAHPGVDAKKIILLGSVAGGGDPAAVTAALDRRIQAAVPFNFGGPQPETRYPLPRDAEDRFNYAGSGSWESTRNLRLSARDGFLPWVIVGGIAPRRLIYAHEFSWDRDDDPVWKRLQKIYELYGVPTHLAAASGRGQLSGRPPQATHCNNIGAAHRQRGIYAAFQRWFGIAIPDREESERRPSSDLLCLTEEVRKKRKPRPAHELARELAQQRLARARQARNKGSAAERRAQLRQQWSRLLGDVSVPTDLKADKVRTERLGKATVERIVLHLERDIVVPLLLLIPPHRAGTRLPVVVGLAQGGKAGFLRHRAGEIARLLDAGMMVALPDVRGTGETSPGSDRGRRSSATGLSSSELMLGQTLVGLRLRDLRCVLAHLSKDERVNPKRITLWGDSFAPVHSRKDKVAVPLDASDLPPPCEPLGGLLALLGGLFEEEVHAIYIHGGLTGYQSLLDSPFIYVPHDVIIPGVLTAGDLEDVAAALAPRPLRLEALVDGLNRRATQAEARAALEIARKGYEEMGAGKQFHLDQQGSPDKTGVAWLLVRR
jgi:dienelactone hydrolase